MRRAFTRLTRSRRELLSVALIATLLGLAPVAALSVSMVNVTTADAHAAPLRYIPGYSVQGQRPAWLCYGWGNGAYHCTRWWHRRAEAIPILKAGRRRKRGDHRWPPRSPHACVVSRPELLLRGRLTQ